MRYYICHLKPSDLISLYASGFTEILEQLSVKEWTQIYQNDYNLMISVGDFHSLAVTGDGQIVAWGNSSHGQCSLT